MLRREDVGLHVQELGSEQASPRLGPFEVEALIGAGAMAQVWRARHLQQGVPVALKVMTSKVAREERWRVAFAEEVRAVARLQHPHVILVFDHGTVDARAARESGGELPEGAAWLAMELAAAGSLDQVQEVLPWSELRPVIIALLDALAHAHARGVIHRDLKPANILLGSASDHRPGLKLSDFGLAHVAGSKQELEIVSGTPRFMAPEQFRADWRSYGPWTDLYALGCLVWHLVAGRPPYVGRDVRILGQQHMYAEPPALAARRPMPRGLEAWLLRLLEKAPADRFACAADAAWALGALVDPEGDSGERLQGSPLVVSNPTLTLDSTFVTQVYTKMNFAERELGETSAARLAPQTPPPLPASWKRASPPPPSIRLVGAGLGLYGLRSIPMVDREGVRDQVWATLRAAREAADPRALVLRGASGTGKSRVVQWMSERAHELGAATVLQAVHSAQRGGADGLGPAWERHLGTLGLDRSAVEDRLRERMGDRDPSERLAVAELLCPAPADHAGPVVRFGSDRERYALMARLLAEQVRHRPVVFWMDDVQWGDDALRFAHFLLERDDAGAVLLLLTVQEEALAERTLERELLAPLLSNRRCRAMSIEPLAAGDRAELVRELLGLSGELAAQVEERCGGNPLFAVQLVGDWVARELLVPGPSGFELREGARSELPDNVHQVWAARIERALGCDASGGRRVALELAAALGQDVRASEWGAACAQAGVAAPNDLVDALQTRRLAVRGDQGWSFAHGMVRESVERAAVERGTWASANAACARLLEAASGEALRLGRHWVAAGEPVRAMQPLLRATRRQLDTAALLAARTTLELAQRVFIELESSEARAEVELALLRAELWERIERPEDARAEAARAHALAVAAGWAPEAAKALHRQGCVAKARGDVVASLQHHRAAIAAFEALGDSTSAAHGHVGVAVGLILQGDIAGATAELALAKPIFEAVGDARGLVDCVRNEGDLARLRLDWDASSACFARAMELFTELGDRAGYAANLHGLAEIQRLQGRLDEAEAGYRRCIELEEQVGKATVIPRFNLGLCLLARREYVRADEVFLALQAVWHDSGNLAYVGLAQISRVPAAAGLGRWELLDELLVSGIERLDAAGMVDVDIAQATELAGDLCAAAEQGERAAAAWAIALRQWEALSASEDAGRVRAKLG